MTEPIMTEGGCEITLAPWDNGDTLMQMKVEPHAKGGLTTATVASAPEGREKILGRYATVRLTPRDRAALRAALDEEDSDYVRLVNRQGDLLTATVKALRGDPPELVWWSHHDVAELATAAVEVAARWLMVSQADPRLRMTKCMPKWEELTDVQKENFRSAVRAALVAEADSRKE